jgi:hypothetical protein
MLTHSDIDLADRTSRKRPYVIAAATLIYAGIHVLMRPLYYARGAEAGGIDWWAVNTVLLIVGLATGGALLQTRRVRGLVNDEVSREHYRRAVVAGYAVAMATSMTIYLVPQLARLAAREAVYLVVTPSIIVPLAVFAYLEHRANRDA